MSRANEAPEHMDIENNGSNPLDGISIPTFIAPAMQYFICEKIQTSSVRGKRFHYQLSLDNVPLFHAKLKAPHQKEPFPISAGSETHYSNSTYIMESNHEGSHFVLKEGEKVIFECEMTKQPEEAPKKIEAVYKPEDGPEIRVVNQEPVKKDNGEWFLDFDGRFAIPSIKNAVLINPESQDVLFNVRKVEPWEINVDSIPGIPHLFLFATIMALVICDF